MTASHCYLCGHPGVAYRKWYTHSGIPWTVFRCGRCSIQCRHARLGDGLDGKAFTTRPTWLVPDRQLRGEPFPVAVGREDAETYTGCEAVTVDPSLALVMAAIREWDSHPVSPSAKCSRLAHPAPFAVRSSVQGTPQIVKWALGASSLRL